MQGKTREKKMTRASDGGGKRVHKAVVDCAEAKSGGHHHNHLIHHHHHVLVQHSTPQAAGETSQTGLQTRPHREQPRRCQGPRPDEARARSPAVTQDRRQAATQTCRRAATATRSQTQAQAQARRHDGSASPTARGRPLRHSAPAIPGPEAAAPSTAPPHRHRRRRLRLFAACTPPRSEVVARRDHNARREK